MFKKHKQVAYSIRISESLVFCWNLSAWLSKYPSIAPLSMTLWIDTAVRNSQCGPWVWLLRSHRIAWPLELNLPFAVAQHDHRNLLFCCTSQDDHWNTMLMLPSYSVLCKEEPPESLLMPPKNVPDFHFLQIINWHSVFMRRLSHTCRINP